MESHTTFGSLPRDMVLQCLVRVPAASLAQVRQVCRGWGELLATEGFHKERITQGRANHCVCIILPLPEQSGVRRITAFDYKRGESFLLPPIPDYPRGLPTFRQMVVVDRKLFVRGGLLTTLTARQFSRKVFCFDLSTQKWKRCGDIPTVSFACGAMDGKIYLAGKKKLVVYDVSKDIWHSLPQKLKLPLFCWGTCVDGEFAVVAKRQFVGSVSADYFNPISGMWRSEHCTQLGRSDRVSIANIQGQLHMAILRGERRDNSSIKRPILYREEKNTWTEVCIYPEAATVHDPDTLCSLWISSTQDGEMLLLTRQVFGPVWRLEWTLWWCRSTDDAEQRAWNSVQLFETSHIELVTFELAYQPSPLLLDI